MPQCNHEKEDTHIIVHVRDSLEGGDKSVMVHIVDTDVIVLPIGHL